MALSQEHPNERILWTGGAYEGREGIAIVPEAGGLRIVAWYDGGVSLDGEGFISWADLDALTKTVPSDSEKKA